jgi:hypothetical protein
MFIKVLSLIVSDMGLVPRLETLKSMLAPNASFEDPLMCAHGYANLVVLLVK